MLCRKASRAAVLWAVLCITTGSLSAQNSAGLILSEAFEHTVCGSYMDYLQDESAKLNLPDVRLMSEKFQPVGRDIFNQSHSASDFWFRIKLTNRQNSIQKYFFELTYGAVDFLDFYIVRDNKTEEYTAGDYRPFQVRPFAHHNPVLPVAMNPGENLELYVSVRTGSSVVLPFHLYSETAFREKDAWEQLLYGGYFGIMIIMFFYNLFLSLSLRSVSYLFYILYISVISLMNFNLLGFGMQYVWPDSLEFQNRSLPAFVCLGITFGLAFSMKLLNTGERMPRFHKFYFGLAVLAAVPAIVSAFGYFGGLLNRVTHLLGLIFTLSLIVGGVRSMLSGYKPARYFVIAWFVFLLGSLSFILRNMGYLPSSILTDNGLLIGSAAEVALLSLALADRINVFRRDKESAQREALIQKNAILDATARFVPEEFVSVLNRQSITDVSLGDSAERIMTVLFSDIRSFTTISEKMTPQESFSFLNTYLAGMVPLVRKNGGYIDKYVGDAMMALFADRASDAISCAVAMHLSLDEGRKLSENPGNALRIGTGIHTGRLMLGTIGEKDRMDVTVISDAVNVASRLENLTKALECRLIISAESLSDDAGRKFQVRFLGTEYVLGKTESVQIFEVLDADPPHKKEQKLASRSDFEKAVSQFEVGNIEDSTKIFAAINAEYPEDGPARSLQKRGMRLLRLREGMSAGERPDLW